MSNDLGGRNPRHPERQGSAVRPKEVDIAFWLWLAAVVCFLISIPVALPVPDAAPKVEPLPEATKRRKRGKSEVHAH